MKLTELIKSHPYLTCLSAGIIYSVQFWSDYTFLFAFPGLALYFAALFFRERKAFFRLSYVFCMGFFIPLYYWFAALYPFAGFGFSKAEGVLIIILACVGISLYHSLLTAGVMWLLKFTKPKTWQTPLVFAALWTVAEWFLSIGDLGFSWGKAAVGQVSFLPFVQTASLFGTYFITFIVAAASGYIALFFKTKEKVPLIIAASILLGNLAIGTVIRVIPESKDNVTDIAIIQGCITTEDKWAGDRYSHSVDTYVRLCEEAADNGAKLIFLPESPFPRYTNEDLRALAPLKEVAMEKNVTVLTGALIEKDGRHYNSIAAIYPDGSVSGFYGKKHPVPFGEFIPYGNLLTTLFPPLGDLHFAEMLTPGDTTGLIGADGFVFGPMVCFDSIFPDCAKDAENDGSNALFVATNDSWYKSTRGVYEHLKFSQLRAIETGLPVIRAANTGISSIISSKGKILAETEPMVEDILYGEGYSVKSFTLYSVIGDTFLYVCMLGVALMISHYVYSSKRKQVQQ